MKSRSELSAVFALLTLLAAPGAACALEVTQAVWQRFTLDQAQTAGISLRGYRLPQFAPTLTPVIGLNYENAQTASAIRGAWLEAGRIGAFAAGPIIGIDRQLSLSSRTASRGIDTDRDLRFGGFLAYVRQGEEAGRIALTTGRIGGIDIKATRSFKLTDSMSLDIGPTISLGTYERFGYDQAIRNAVAAGGLAPSYNVDRAQLGAFGLATAIETRVNDRTVARMFADYARIEAQRNQPGIGSLTGRDRVDVGFSLTTKIGE